MTFMSFCTTFIYQDPKHIHTRVDYAYRMYIEKGQLYSIKNKKLQN